MNKATQAECVVSLTSYARRLMERYGATPAQAQAALQARVEVSPARALGCVMSAMRKIRKEAQQQAGQ